MIMQATWHSLGIFVNEICKHNWDVIEFCIPFEDYWSTNQGYVLHMPKTKCINGIAAGFVYV